MATLQELRPQIDNNRQAVLFLASNDPLNATEKDVKVHVNKLPNGIYNRKLTYVGMHKEGPKKGREFDQWDQPHSQDLTWNQLTDSESALAEATSDQWTIHQS